MRRHLRTAPPPDDFEALRLESLRIMAGGLAHDFNTMLTVIVGNAALARFDLPQESPAQEYLTHIEAAATRATDLTRQLLAYSGRGRFVVQRVDLSCRRGVCMGERDGHAAACWPLCGAAGCR